MHLPSDFFSRFFPTFLLVLLMSGCAAMTPPVQEMSNARQTIQAAKEAGAEVHAAASLAQAEELLQQASQEIEDGDYVSARNSALRARQLAMQARENALRKKQDD
ncbi:MAG TPA: DUF4398 domain-containing protein [Gammaproteobacteria bacterium]|nr:DUF4398 domain-containing protein [Gammaproteobacteria bacterium]